MHAKVKAAFFSFGRIEDEREHHDYNWWHRFDHMPEVHARQGVAYVQRFVSPPRYIEARVTSGSELGPYQYLTCYLIEEPLDDTFRIFREGGRALGEAGRQRGHTPSVHGTYMLMKAYAAPRSLVSPDAIPYRPSRGVYLSVADVIDRSRHDAIARWYDQVHIPDMLTVKHVAGCWWFNGMEATWGPEWPPGAPLNRTIRVFYLDGDPLEMVEDMHRKAPEWRAAGRIMDNSRAVERLLSGPFLTINDKRFDWFDGG